MVQAKPAEYDANNTEVMGLMPEEDTHITTFTVAVPFGEKVYVKAKKLITLDTSF